MSPPPPPPCPAPLPLLFSCLCKLLPSPYVPTLCPPPPPYVLLSCNSCSECIHSPNQQYLNTCSVGWDVVKPTVPSSQCHRPCSSTWSLSRTWCTLLGHWKLSLKGVSRQQWLVSMLYVCVCVSVSHTVHCIRSFQTKWACTLYIAVSIVTCTTYIHIYCCSNSYNCGCCWMVLRRYNSQKSWTDQQCPQPIQRPLPVWGAQPHQDQHGDSTPEGQHTPAALRWVHSFTPKQKRLRSFVSILCFFEW